MPTDDELGFPTGNRDERELLLSWLAYLRSAVVRNLDGLGEVDARWTPGDALISPLGVLNHLTHVEWRWIDGAMRGHPVSRSEEEFRPGGEITVAAAIAAYRDRAHDTDEFARATPLDTPSRTDPASISAGCSST